MRTARDSARIALVSCVKTKRLSRAPAQDLYVSELFKSMRRYAEKNANDWFILSAKHGLLSPAQVIAPYEQTLNTTPKAERMAWAASAQEQLVEALPPRAKVIILAGERYREHLVPFLIDQGFEVEIPMKGLRFGPQLRWLKPDFRIEVSTFFGNPASSDMRIRAFHASFASAHTLSASNRSPLCGGG